MKTPIFFACLLGLNLFLTFAYRRSWLNHRVFYLFMCCLNGIGMWLSAVVFGANLNMGVFTLILLLSGVSLGFQGARVIIRVTTDERRYSSRSEVENNSLDKHG